MKSAGQIYRLKITLRGSKPRIWRRVEVPGEVSLGDLHRVIQGVMDWEESHLHEFTFGKSKRPGAEEIKDWMRRGGESVDELWGETRYSDPLFDMEETHDEWATTLAQAAPEPKVKFLYTYDMGDGWEHEIVVEKIVPAEEGVKYPRCTGGAMRAPMEDSGGIWGWMDKVCRVNDKDDDESEGLREWMGVRKGETFDAKHFDLEESNKRMVKVMRAYDAARKSQGRRSKRKNI